jgi:hypothetical protein
MDNAIVSFVVERDDKLQEQMNKHDEDHVSREEFNSLQNSVDLLTSRLWMLVMAIMGSVITQVIQTAMHK